MIFQAVPRLASAVTWSRVPLPWSGFTQGPFITATCPIRVQPDQEVLPWNKEGGGGQGTGPGRRLGGRQEVRVQGGPAGWGRAGQPQKYAPVSREGTGTSAVVRGKGGGWVSDIKNKEEINTAILLTSILEHEEANKVKEELEDSRDKDDNNQPILQKMIIPSDINYIQPRDTQVWNCGEVGFDPSKIWSKVICTYKFFQGERMWKVQTGERATFWCALLVFTQADGKWFMPPRIVHQAK